VCDQLGFGTFNGECNPRWLTGTVSSGGSEGNGAFGMAAADFDGNGLMDVAAANANDDTVSLYLNDGLTFRTLLLRFVWQLCGSRLRAGQEREVLGKRMGFGAGAREGGALWPCYAHCAAAAFSANLLGPRGVAAGDFNGDGHVDLAAVYSTNGVVLLFLNNGSASFSASVVSAAVTGAVRVVAGDLDGDGTLDLAVTRPSTLNAVTIFYNVNNTATFPSSQVFSTTAAIGAWGIVLADIDGDSDLDVVISSDRRSSDVILYINAGNRIFFPITAGQAPGGRDLAVVVRALDARLCVVFGRNPSRIAGIGRM
jgi:hypothetical protein